MWAILIGRPFLLRSIRNQPAAGRGAGCGRRTNALAAAAAAVVAVLLSSSGARTPRRVSATIIFRADTNVRVRATTIERGCRPDVEEKFTGRTRRSTGRIVSGPNNAGFPPIVLLHELRALTTRTSTRRTRTLVYARTSAQDNT